jgi:lincosamide nucleotidyltransferase A/C/D/E
MQTLATGPGAGAPREMPATDVLAFLELAKGFGVRVWLDGGWAVDACLERQTRPHADLDIVVEERHLARLTGALQDLGYRPVPRDDTRAWNFVLGDAVGHEIDFHVTVLDAHGAGSYGPAARGEPGYPAEALRGRGTIEGRPVACIAPEWLVRFHSGYELTAKDEADVNALCDRFGIPLPDEYVRRRASSD